MKSNSIKITNLKKIKFPSSPFRVTSQTALPICTSSKAGSASAVSLVTLKGLDRNLILLQVFSLHTI